MDALVEEIERELSRRGEDEENAGEAAEDSGLQTSSYFLDELPEDHPDRLAFEALMNEDKKSPAEKAEDFKDEGNNNVKKGKRYYRAALDCYTQALSLDFEDAEMKSVIHSNRAHINLLLGNYRRALKDAMQAMQLNPENIKAYYRAAKAAVNIRMYRQAEQIALKGLEIEFEDNPALEKVLKDATEKRARQEREDAELDFVRKEFEHLARTIISRGVFVLPAAFDSSTSSTMRPSLDADGWIHWPALLLYCETMTQDVVQDWCETTLVRDQLDAMFGHDAPPLPWDSQGQYARDRVELYYQEKLWSDVPLDEDDLADQIATGKAGNERQRHDVDSEKRNFILVPENISLGDLLKLDSCVVRGVPCFFVLARETPFHEKFLSGQFQAVGY